MFSVHKYAIALGISDWNVQRIVNRELKMHFYKMGVAQEFSERNYTSHKSLCDVFQ